MKYTYSCFAYTAFCLIFLLQPTLGEEEEIVLSDEQKQMQFEKSIQCYFTHFNDSLPSKNDTFCPWTWDTWGCWPNTQPGEVAFIHCPTFVPGSDPKKWANKVCLPNGTWFKHPETNMVWSNYTLCELDQLSHLPPGGFIIYYVGYSLSIITCGLSLIIFFYFRNLGCPRVTIHKNLFLSFILNGSSWIITYAVVDLYPEINGAGCRFLHILVQYFNCCNYSWMLCEGVYLFYLLVISVFSEEKRLYLFYLLGWAAPLIPISLYLTMMLVTEPNECWLEKFSNYNWIVIGFLILVLAINFGIIIGIVIVLVIKLKAQPSTGSNSAIEAVQKAMRATFILLPLLGLHQIFTTPPAPPLQPWRDIYLSIGAIFQSFQGFFVSCLFCFFNGEVRMQFRRKYRTFTNKRSLSQRGSSRKHMMYTVTTEINEDTPEHRRRAIQLSNGSAESNSKSLPSHTLQAAVPDGNKNGGSKLSNGVPTRTSLNSQIREEYSSRIPLTLHDASRKKSESFV